MSKTDDRGRFDWLVELGGAAAPAAAAGYAAAMIAPGLGWPPGTALLAGFGLMFAVGFSAIRLMPAGTRYLAVPHFDPPLLLDDPLPDDEILLLDQPLAEDILLLDQPMIEDGAMGIGAATRKLAELLLDDPLPVPAADSRVVQLFADGRPPTAGELSQRIDRHLSRNARPAGAADASDALTEALAQLRRSLRA